MQKILNAFTAFFFLAFAVLVSTPAQALSCAQPKVDAEMIAATDVIFEGVVTGERRMVGGEEDDVTVKLQKTATFTFQVTRGWKGVGKGAVLTIGRNTYWGDGFQMGQPYLVFASRSEKDNMLTAALCGPTVPLQYADAYKKVLAEHYAVQAQPPLPPHAE